MDPKPQMPDIKAEVNKIDDGKKKATGLMGLLGGGGGSAAGGLGGLGAGAVGGGGMLATKAGMLALVLMGSAVAGGIGLAGYKMFGPGEADRTGGNLSLFAPRAQPAEDPNAVAPVAADGSSASLNFASAAAAKDKAAEAAEAAAAAASASAEAPKDNAADDPAKEAAAADRARREAEARASAGGALAPGGGGAAGTMGRGLANTKKLGALSSAVGGGSGSTSASASTKLGENLASAAKNGASSAFSRQGGGAAKASSARGVASRNGRSARSQARNVMGDQGGGKAGSSFAAGRTYDGSASNAGGAIGPGAGSIGMDGVGDGAGAQAKSLPANSKGSTKEQDPPVPEPPAKDVTPWAKEIMAGMALGALAIGLLYAAKAMIETANKEAAAAIKLMASVEPLEVTAGIAAYKVALATLTWAKVVVYAALAAAAGGMILGGMISGGNNGQVLQGGLLIASSAAIAAIGATYLITCSKPPALPTEGDPASIKAASDMAAFAAPAPWMTVIGGAAAIGLVGTMMAPKKTCKSDQDSCHAYYQQRPSPINYSV